MILADTSVWIDHFRRGDPTFARLLVEQSILMHPFVLGELACGNLHRRSQTLADLQTLPSPPTASDNEVRNLIEERPLFGRGVGWIDAHLLLASAILTPCSLWAIDARLAKVARELDIGLC